MRRGGGSLGVSLKAAIKETLRNAFRAWVMLLRAMVPVTILVKALTELDLLQYLVAPLKPIMALVNLPADLVIAWISAVCVNLYAGLFVYADLLKTLPEPLSVAQATTFATMSVIAHAIFAEGKIAQYCGVSMLLQMAIRVCTALVFGLVFSQGCAAFGWLAEPAVMLYTPAPAPGSLWLWALLEARSYLLLLLVVSGLMLFMRLLRAVRVTDLINTILNPLFRLMGIGPSAATITVIGLTMGLSYGGGLIINEARGGVMPKRDVFASLTFMGLSHAMIEDTLIMAAMGASVIGVIGGRLLISFLVMLLVASLLRRLGPPAPLDAPPAPATEVSL